MSYALGVSYIIVKTNKIKIITSFISFVHLSVILKSFIDLFCTFLRASNGFLRLLTAGGGGDHV